MSESIHDSDWGDLALLVPSGRRYARPPIIEALLELRVEPSQSVTLERLESMLSGDDTYLPPSPTVQIQGQIEILEDDVVGTTSGNRVGYVHRRRDDSRAVQAHLDRFGYSWSSPYGHWDAFLSEAEDHWRKYIEAAEPLRVTGIGIRFVNRIDVPHRSVEIRDYLRTSIDVSPYLPQAISRLFMQVDIPLKAYRAVATVTSALAEPVAEGHTSLILDIDTKRPVDLPLSSPSFHEDLVSNLSTLRDAKNFVFEACITDATRGLIS